MFRNTVPQTFDCRRPFARLLQDVEVLRHITYWDYNGLSYICGCFILTTLIVLSMVDHRQASDFPREIYLL